MSLMVPSWEDDTYDISAVQPERYSGVNRTNYIVNDAI